MTPPILATQNRFQKTKQESRGGNVRQYFFSVGKVSASGRRLSFPHECRTQSWKIRPINFWVSAPSEVHIASSISEAQKYGATPQQHLAYYPFRCECYCTQQLSMRAGDGHSALVPARRLFPLALTTIAPILISRQCCRTHLSDHIHPLTFANSCELFLKGEEVDAAAVASQP